MSAEIFCFDHESQQFKSISSIGPSTRWATSIIGEVVNVIQISCLPDDKRTEIKVMASDITPDEAITPVNDMLDGLDPDSAWIDEVVDERTDATLNISDPKYPGQGTTIVVRHREPQNWHLN